MGELPVIEITQKVMKLFKDNGIDCWIIGGILLKLYREDDISKLKDDIDLGFFMKDREKVLELHYGINWRTPIDQTWYYWFVPARDLNYLKRDMNKTNSKGEIIY